MCVQRFDDSLNSAIHITYRISLRSSSMPEPRDPLLKVLIYLNYNSDDWLKTRVCITSGGRMPGLRPAAAFYSGGPRQSNKGVLTTKGWRSGRETLTH